MPKRDAEHLADIDRRLARLVERARQHDEQLERIVALVERLGRPLPAGKPAKPPRTLEVVDVVQKRAA